MAEIYMRRSDLGSRTCGNVPSMSLAASDMIVLNRFERAALKQLLPSHPDCRIRRARRRDRMFGVSSSPLLTTTNRTDKGGFPVRRRAPSMGRVFQITLESKKLRSFCLAARTSAGSSTRPVR